MKTEHKKLLTLLADYLSDKPTEIGFEADEIDWLLQLSQQQQIASAVYNQTQLPQLKPMFASFFYFYVNRKNLLSAINKVFKENDVRYLLFKGTEISKYYTHPEQRTMGDSDFLVHKEDLEKANEILVSIGFKLVKQTWMEWVYINNGIEIELHHRLLYDEITSEDKIKVLTDTAWEHSFTEDSIQYHLELEFHLVFLLIHLRKHLLHTGVGFRQFMDLAVVAKQEIDWDKVADYLNQIELFPFAANCYALIERWFGVTTPITGEVTDEFYEKATEAIFENGVFGMNNDENADNRTINNIRKKGKFKYFISNIFPSYKNMITCESYSFLIGKPFLLPFAWIYRFFVTLKTKKAGNGINATMKAFTINDEISQREQYLKQWGLLE